MGSSREQVDAALEYALDLVVRVRPADPMAYVESKLREHSAGGPSEPEKISPLSAEEAALGVRSYLQATITPALADALMALSKQDPEPERPVDWIANWLEESHR